MTDDRTSPNVPPHVVAVGGVCVPLVVAALFIFMKSSREELLNLLAKLATAQLLC